nr:MAG TPA: hypothetical protein [Caudoviricetes sp.]
MMLCQTDRLTVFDIQERWVGVVSTHWLTRDRRRS